MTVHVFDSTGEAYDRSQWDDAIKDGDILLVPSEGVAGWLHQAWPIAATRNAGQFHRLNEAAAIGAEVYGPRNGEHITRKINEAVEALHAHGRSVVAVAEVDREAALEAALEDEAYARNAAYDAAAATTR